MITFAIILLTAIAAVSIFAWLLGNFEDAMQAGFVVAILAFFLFFSVAGVAKLTTGDSGLDDVTAYFFGSGQRQAVVEAPKASPSPTIQGQVQPQGQGYSPHQDAFKKDVNRSMDGITAFFLAFAFLFSGAWIWLWFGIYMLVGSCFWYDDKIPNGIWLTLGATVLWFVLWPHAWGSITEHVFQLFVYAIPSYLALGTAWSFAKFRFTMRDMRDQILGAKEAALKEYKEDGVKVAREVSHSLSCAYPATVFLTSDQIRDGDYLPKLTKGRPRNKIINWIMFWPWSVVNYVFGKLLHDVLNAIVDMFGKVYHRIAVWTLGDLIKTPKV